jgi:hypothetical protein
MLSKFQILKSGTYEADYDGNGSWFIKRTNNQGKTSIVVFIPEWFHISLFNINYVYELLEVSPHELPWWCES